MQITNFWYKQYLCREKIALLLFILLVGASTNLWGQQRKTFGMTRVAPNLPNYDSRFLHYGFTIGLNSGSYKITQSSGFTTSDTIIGVTPDRGPGFSLGFVVNARLGEFFDLRLLPQVSFYERKINYQFKGRGTIAVDVDNTFIEFPLLVKYKSQRRKNMRMYVVGGIKPGIEAGSKKKDKKASELRTNNLDFAVDYGFGFDIYYPLFKFAPEIRISHGLVNMMNADPNEFSRSVNLMLTHTVTLYLNFE